MITFFEVIFLDEAFEFFTAVGVITNSKRLDLLRNACW